MDFAQISRIQTSIKTPEAAAAAARQYGLGVLTPVQRAWVEELGTAYEPDVSNENPTGRFMEQWKASGYTVDEIDTVLERVSEQRLGFSLWSPSAPAITAMVDRGWSRRSAVIALKVERNSGVGFVELMLREERIRRLKEAQERGHEREIERLVGLDYTREEARRILEIRDAEQQRIRREAEQMVKAERDAALYEEAMKPLLDSQDRTEVAGIEAWAPRPHYVYVLQAEREGQTVSKVGIASSLSRMNEHEKRRWELVHVETFSTEVAARNVETEVKRRIRETPSPGVPAWATMNMTQGGRTEVTTIPAVQLIAWVRDLSQRGSA